MLLAIYFIIPSANRIYFLATTGTFIKQQLRDPSRPAKNEPCLCEKFRTHLKLAYKMGTTKSTNLKQKQILLLSSTQEATLA
jgi:hypothetical protein